MHPNFDEMSQKDFLAYFLAHRDDDEVFHAYKDRLATAPVLVRSTAEDARDPAKFAAILAKVERIRQGLEPPEG